MDRIEKEQAIQDLSKVFNESNSVFLFGFSKINVPAVTELRRMVAESGSSYKVVKNRLAVRAAQETAVAPMAEHFQGPTAVAYTEGDPVALAKVMKDFSKDHPGLEFKAGVLESTALSGDEVRQLAEMPSRDELLSKMVYLFNSPLSRLAAALQSPLRDLASLLKQLADTKK